MRQPDWADRVFRAFYPNVMNGDPTDLVDFANTFLVPELSHAVCRYYGSTSTENRCRWPGVDYNDPGWRQRLCQMPFQYHRELFRIFEALHLSSFVIDQICTWWGTKAEVEAWERRHPGRVIEDDVWEGISRLRVASSPRATFHETPADQTRLPATPLQRRRTSRLRNFFSRPRAITSWRDLHRPSSAEISQAEQLSSQHSGPVRLLDPRLAAIAFEEAASSRPDDDEDVVQASVGVDLNRQLQAGIRNSEFEEWLKEEAEEGRSSNPTPPLPSFSRYAITTDTISYSPPHQHGNVHTYAQRVNHNQYQGDLHTLPVAVSGPSESAMRSSQPPRQNSLARYRTTPYHQYRPIRPRPARSSS